MHEEGLSKVRLDTDNLQRTRQFTVKEETVWSHLMMDIMIVGVVPGHELERIPGEGITTVVIDGLQCGDGEQDHGLPGGQTCAPLRDSSSQCIEEEAFDGVVIKRPESIRHVQAMMPGVEVPVQELVDMHGAMEEVLPGVDDEPVARD